MADVPNWRVSGDWFDLCRCRVPCGCTFAQAPDEEDCDGILAWHINEGSYGDVSLDGLNIVAPTEDATELHPAGRDKDPVITRDWVSGERGQLLLHLFTDLDLYRLQQLVPSSRTMLIQWSNGGQLYCRITDQPIVRVRGTYATATLTYTQQARPT